MPPKTRNDRPGSGRSAEARARAAARREQIRKAEQRRRMGFLGLWGVVGVVVIVVIALIVVNTRATSKGKANVTGAAPAAVTSNVTSIPAAAFTTAGVKGVGTGISGIQTLSGGKPVTTAGHPTVIYVGGEFCPYCAAERWPLAAALSRFGSFSGLQVTQSSGTDAFPNTSTLSFLTTKFTSQYVSFTPSEVLDRAQKPLQTAPAASEAAMKQFDPKGTIPFITLNNQFQVPVQYDVGLLKDMTASQISAAIKDPTSKVGAAVLASANVVTAGICRITNGQPGSVCNTPEVTAAAPFLDAQTSGSGSSTP